MTSPTPTPSPSSPLGPSISQIFANKALHVVLDWDGTLTETDTLEALVQIALTSKASTNPSKAAQLSTAWKEIKQLYMADLAKTTEEAYGPLMSRSLVQRAATSSILEERLVLSRMLGVEERSVKRVSEAGIFSGITQDDISRGAASAISSGSVRLRRGWSHFFSLLSSRISSQISEVDSVDIISVNWSRSFICRCLHSSSSPLAPESVFWTHFTALQEQPFGATKQRLMQLQIEKTEPFNYEFFNDEFTTPLWIKVFANQLDGVEHGQPSSGQLLPVFGAPGHRLRTSADKLRYLLRARRISPETMKPMPLIYIGDSWTDFDCLLAADLGICIRDSPMSSTQQKLADAFVRTGVRCPRLREVRELEEWGVVWAADFEEVREFVERLGGPVVGEKGMDKEKEVGTQTETETETDSKTVDVTATETVTVTMSESKTEPDSKTAAADADGAPDRKRRREGEA